MIFFNVNFWAFLLKVASVIVEVTYDAGIKCLYFLSKFNEIIVWNINVGKLRINKNVNLLIQWWESLCCFSLPKLCTLSCQRPSFYWLSSESFNTFDAFESLLIISSELNRWFNIRFIILMSYIKRSLKFVNNFIIFKLPHEIFFLPISKERIWSKSKISIVKWTVNWSCFGSHQAIKLDCKLSCIIWSVDITVCWIEYVTYLFANICYWSKLSFLW